MSQTLTVKEQKNDGILSTRQLETETFFVITTLYVSYRVDASTYVFALGVRLSNGLSSSEKSEKSEKALG